MIPVAGSAYTYGYATLGELFAWIIGWDLDPRVHGRRQPGADRLVGLPRQPARTTCSSRSGWRCRTPGAPRPGAPTPAILNLPAVLIVGLLTWLLVRGIKESCARSTSSW